MTLDEFKCKLCNGRNFMHHLDCNKNTQLLSECDKPQEFNIIEFYGHFFQIQNDLMIRCHRCGGCRNFWSIKSAEETKKLGIGYKKGEIIYKCHNCGLLGVIEFSEYKKNKIKKSLKLEGYLLN